MLWPKTTPFHFPVSFTRNFFRAICFDSKLVYRQCLCVFPSKFTRFCSVVDLEVWSPFKAGAFFEGSVTHLTNIPGTLELTGRVAPENRPKLPQKGKEKVCQPQWKKTRLLCASLLWTDPQSREKWCKVPSWEEWRWDLHRDSFIETKWPPKWFFALFLGGWLYNDRSL